MFAFQPGAKRAAAKPAAKRTPSVLRGGRRKDSLTTITADPLLAEPAVALPPATWDVTAPDGSYAGAFQGSTPEDAILSYVATLGYASIADAALAQGFADAATYVSAFVVTETLAPAGMDPSLAPVDPLAAPAALSRRGRPLSRRGRKASFMVSESGAEAVGPFEAATPEEAVGLYIASLGYGSADEAAAALGYASTESFLASIIATEQMGDDLMLPEDEYPPATLSRRGRRGRKSAGEIIVGLGTILAGGLGGYLAGWGLGWVFSTIEDAYQNFMDWWDQPSSPDRTARLQQSLEDLRIVENTLVQQLAATTEPVFASELEATLAVLRSVIAQTESELNNPAQTLADDIMLPDDNVAPEMLSRRSRKSIARRLRLKATFTVADAETGEVIGTYDATTSDDAILSYVTALGYETVESAATGEGFATVEEFLATITVTEGEAAAPAEPETPAETLARRHRLRMKATFEAIDPATGEVLGTFDAGTIDDAILSYAASLGYGSADEAAAAAGLTVEDWLATFTITEVAPAAEAPPAEAELEIEIGEEEDEEEVVPPAAMSRRRA